MTSNKAVVKVATCVVCAHAHRVNRATRLIDNSTRWYRGVYHIQEIVIIIGQVCMVAWNGMDSSVLRSPIRSQWENRFLILFIFLFLKFELFVVCAIFLFIPDNRENFLFVFVSAVTMKNNNADTCLICLLLSILYWNFKNLTMFQKERILCSHTTIMNGQDNFFFLGE